MIQRLRCWAAALLIGFLTHQTIRAQPVPPPDSVRHRLILIGDAGRLRHGKNPVIDAVQARYDLDNTRTTLLYLGDNVYPHGLEDENHPDHDSLATILRYQANPGRAQPGLARPGLGKKSNVLFIPGNHDWGKGRPDGWEKIRRQGRFLDSLHAPNIRLLPTEGCPGPEVVPLDDNLILVVIDTQWWLHPYDKPGRDSDCACKDEEEVLTRLADIANRNKDKGIILATHHPFRSYGIHGGYYTLKQHIFPLTDAKPGLYLPLPVIGSIYPLARGVFGNIQDLPNPTYKAMVRRMEEALAPAPNVLFVSGHDHALQRIVDGNRTYLVSGAGINQERVKRGKKAQYVHPGWGYAVVDHLASGTVRVTFFEVDAAAHAQRADSTALFRLTAVPRTSTGALDRPKFPDSVRVAVAPEYDRVSGLHRLILGGNYRKEWATTVNLPVFDITRTQGGFKVLQRGGGQQTKSLRLEAPDGKEWVLRTVQKAPERALPDYLRRTVASAIVQDAISAGHPYAPLTVPVLADAAGVPHANPQFYYIPDDPALGDYQTDFGNTVCILEERNPGGDTKSLSTPKVLKALDDDNDDRVDQRAVLRARLLDLFIGDWDRHEDQWRWASRKTKTGKEFYPIPRDRDQVFFRGNGLLIKVASLPWIQPKFQGFRKKLPNVNGFMFNGRYFDRLFLNALSQQDWIEEVRAFEGAMTDAILKQAIQQLPDPVRQLSGDRILETLKARRARLLDYALTYYRFLAKDVDIPGTEKSELFKVEHQDKDHIAVSIFKIAKSGKLEQQLYHRVFETSETHEIRLYGQAGNDQFTVTGPRTHGIKVRIIGGKGDDSFTVDPSSHQPGHTLVYDRSTEANTLPRRQQASIHTSDEKQINQYDPHAFKYNRLAPLLTVGYNLDDGLLLGAGFQWTKQGFRKEPFAMQHKLLVGHALATEATFFRYDGIFTDLIGTNDLWIQANIKAPDNVQNFFGVGNETVFEQQRRIRYYRTRFNLYNLAALLKRPLGQHMQVAAGAVFQHFDLKTVSNRGRFIEDYLDQIPEKAAFVNLESYAGYQVQAIIDNRNNVAIPTRGLFWTTSLQGLQALSDRRSHLTQLKTDLSVYSSFSSAARLVIANRLGGGLTYGNPAFFQLQYLGGQDNLRGFRTYRFAGEKLLYHNIDLRLKLFDFNSFLFPGSFGLTAFNDVGRVWTKGEQSRQWHDGYGGGLFVAPARLLILNASVAFSKESTLGYFSLGYRF